MSVALNLFLIFIFAILIGLITCLLVKKHLTPLLYTTLFISICCFCLALLGFDRLEEFNLKELRIVLKQIEHKKEEIYAKADYVTKIGETFADFFTIISTEKGGAGSSITIEERLKRKEQIKKLFTELGTDKNKVQKTLSAIDGEIVSDLLHNLIFDANSRGKKLSYKEQKIIYNELWSKVDVSDLKKTKTSIIEYCKQHNIDNNALQIFITEFYKCFGF